MSTEPLDGIAIIGMSGRFPGSRDIGQFWRSLLAGQESITHFTDQELLDAGVPAAVLRQSNYVKSGSYLDGIDLFDAAFFGISPREAELMDPQQRLFLEHAWLALEDAGIVPERFGGEIAVFGGASFSTYGLLHLKAEIGHVGSLETVLGNDKDYLATRVSYKLGLRGPSVSVQTACSTSLTAVAMACDSLLNLQADVALAGGVTVKLPLKSGYVFEEGSILSPDGRCRAFDAKARGTIFGSGVGVVALKRLEDAVADGDPIHAVIRGWGVNNDGDHKVGFSAPSVDGQARVIATALAQAGISPDTIGYVEAHGTGTPLGDPIEVRALTRAYGSGAKRTAKCGIGSVKTNVGHLESAAGITGLIKAALAVKHGLIPPSLNFETPNPEIDFPATPFQVVDRLTDWEGQGHPRRAGVNSFGMGGTNVHLVLEQAPSVAAVAPALDRPQHLLALSARSEAALRDLARAYADHVTLAGTAATLGDMAFTAATARRHFSRRLAVQVRTAEDLAGQLKAFADGTVTDGAGEVGAAGAPEIAFLFSGQGSQYAGMGRELYETSPRFRRSLDRCAAILAPLLDRPLLDVMFPPAGQEGLLDDTVYTQPALFSLAYALGDLWASWGVKPAVMLGHSVGEYAAAALAGVFTLEDALKLIAARGRLMQALPRDGAMMTIFADEAAVAEAIRPHAARVSIAAVNAPRSTVISGQRSAVVAIAAGFEAKGVKARPLATSHAFHSPLMQPMMDAFRALAEAVTYRPPQTPILSNLTGRLETTALASADYWCRHVLAPVRFLDGISAAAARGTGVFLEIGPRPVLCTLGRETLDDGPEVAARHWLPSLRRAGMDWRTLLDSLGRLYAAGVEIDWKGFDADYPRRRVAVPGYAFQRRSFWAAPRGGGDPSGRKVRGVATGTDHPLLGQRLRQAGTTEVRFEAALNAAEPAFLTDHRVFDAVVLPATGYLEMALAGGAHLLATDHLSLEGIQFKQVMTLPDAGERIVQAVFASGGPKAYGFEIFSGDAAGEEWTLHCSGTVKPADGMHTANPGSESEELEAVRLRCDAPVPIASVYENYLKRGLDYGPAFRGITDLATGAGETLAHIVLPEAARADGALYRLHPALMDACFQALGAAFGALDDRDTYLPVSLDRLTVRGLVPGDVFSHSHLHRVPDAPEGKSIAAHLSTIRLFDAAGDLVAEAEGLQSRRVTRDVVLPQDANATESWLYDLVWQPADAPHSVRGPGGGAWVLVGAGDGLGALLAERLEANGWAVTALPAAVADGLGGILATTPTLAGIVDLRALDADGEAIAGVAERAAADLLRLVQALIAAGRVADIPLVVLTRDAQGGVGADAMARGQGLATAPLWGLVRTIWHEYPDLPCVALDLDPAISAAEVDQVVAELTAPDGEQQVAYRGGLRHVARLKHHQSDLKQTRLELPDAPYRIDKMPEGGLDRLLVVPHARRRPEAGEVEVEVLGMGLNFRDVLNAMGLYPGDAGPFGGECSGRVLRVGPGVTAVAPGDEVVALHFGTFASHITLPAAVVFKVPNGMPVVEAAGLPIVYLTTWYSLHHLARIKAGDKVLIHSGSGGVGIAAIRIAQMVGAEIFTTASPHKHDFLRSLGVSHIMNSRDVAFADEIRRRTDGRGVDIVLNSLGGDAIPASLSVVVPGGHFVEIGKRDIWSVEQARALRPDVSYAIVNFDITAVEEPELVRDLLAEALELMSRGTLGQPITSVYPVEDALDAMALMQKARHTGKLVLATPAAGTGRKDLQPDATYLITGAFGGIGRLVAGWMVEKGARNLALVGRRAPDASMQAQIETLRAAGAQVQVFAADVSDGAALAEVFTAIDTRMPALRGVIHAAGILDDGVLAALDPARLSSAFAAKVRGAYALHEATRQRPLDLFVMFSSLGSVLGAPGQANYAAANAFLDRLAHWRRGQGLPGLTINWGGWQETGMTTGDAIAAHLAQGGSIPPHKGLQILGQLLRETSAEVGVAPFDWRLYFEGLPRRLSVLADVERELAQEAAAAETFATLRKALRDRDAAGREVLLLDYLRGVIARLLRIEVGEALAPNQSLQDLGLDSLVSIQLRNRIRSELEIDLPVAEMIEAATLAQLVAVVSAKVAPMSADGAVQPAGIVPLGLSEAPLSFAQHRLWFLSRLDPDSAFYTVTFSLFLEGPLDADALQHAAAEIVRRHGSLRTHFPVVEGEPVQRVVPDLSPPLAWVDLSGLPEAEREREMTRLVDAEARRTFDLAQGPLFQLTVLKLGAQLHRAIVAIHHMVTDGWSAVVLIQEIGALYRAYARHQPSPLPEPPVQYTDFAVWQRDWLSGPRLATELAYWRRHLAAPPPALDLPTDRRRSAAGMHRGGALSVMLPMDLAEGLKGLGRSAGAGLFATLMAGFRILLHRLTEAPDIIIGSLVANRDRAEIEGLVGFFANMVVFRGDLSGDPTVRAALAREAETVRGGLAHQEVPFEKLVEELQPERQAGRNPICDVIFVLQRGVPQPDLEAQDLRIGPVWDLNNGTVRFDLEVHVWDTEQGLSVSFIYNADLFDADTVAQLERQFAAVLAAMVAAPDLPVSRLSLGAPAVASPADALAETLQQIEALSDEEVEALLREMADDSVGETP